jgi:hypothetical protein
MLNLFRLAELTPAAVIAFEGAGGSMPSGPGNAGGLNNSVNDPIGVGNAAKVTSSTPPGTNSVGTANSSGVTSSGTTTTGTGSGVSSMTDALRTGNGEVDAQDRAVDRMIKNICKGC